MEFIGVVVGIILLISVYFCVGITLRFIWEWWILVMSTPSLFAAALLYGWIGALVSISLWAWTLTLNNSWHSSAVYFRGADWLDRRFNFKDT
ncbi:hypothetical protein X765_16750 [Mesorhizobium sp. LSHC440B00]|nr:hypothetical protein X765_16750 [Mesorhizobium sp. LSHC440B00]ESX42493.1 hypothetical protein X764_10530 [Mesorhizobium sp. LSHC440A00]